MHLLIEAVSKTLMGFDWSGSIVCGAASNKARTIAQDTTTTIGTTTTTAVMHVHQQQEALAHRTHVYPKRENYWHFLRRKKKTFLELSLRGIDV